MHGRAEERKTGRAGRVEVWMDDNETMEFLVELSSATTYTYPQHTVNTTQTHMVQVQHALSESGLDVT